MSDENPFKTRIPSPASRMLGWTFVSYDREAMVLRIPSSLTSSKATSA